MMLIGDRLPHSCNVYCSEDEHCHLAYVGINAREHDVFQSIAEMVGVLPSRAQLAPEAPPLTREKFHTMWPKEKVKSYGWRDWMTHVDRWLIWFPAPSPARPDANGGAG